MTRLVAEADVDERRLARILAPRHDVVQEAADGDGCFVGICGPFEHYHRCVEVDGLHVRQTVEYRMAFPYFRFLFALPMRSRLEKWLSVITPARFGSFRNCDSRVRCGSSSRTIP